jgi:hypothetical protein
VVSLAEDLLHLLDLEARLVIVECNASTALNMEAYFRRRWWFGNDDSFRNAVHACKFRAHTTPGKSSEVTQAWSKMGERVRSADWRNRIRQLALGKTEREKRSLQLIFGAAQQLWTRAARWNAALGPEANPFAIMAQLFERSCWPLGLTAGCLYVCGIVPEFMPAPATSFPVYNPQVFRRRDRTIFLSASFNQTTNEPILQEIRDRGFKLIHGRVDEFCAPERQLAAKILRAAVTVGFIRCFDSDFGCPWWIFQELDFSTACGRPTALLTSDTVSLPSIEIFKFGNGIIEERFWQWLHSV